MRASLRAKRRCQLIVRLKAIKCYEGLLCYLSSSMYNLLLIAITASVLAILFGLQEVKRRRHFLWNPSTLWGWCAKQVKRTLLSSDTLWLSCLLSGVPKRSGRLFYPLTLLRFNSKRSTKHVRKDYSTFRRFYGLAHHAKHQTGQEKLFWHFTIEPLYSAPSNNHWHRLITPLGLGLICTPCCLICDLYGGIYFKTFGDQGELLIGGWSC